MQDLKIRKIVIVGGGTAGWMVAAAFSKILADPAIKIRLIESEEIGTVGVGEATIPHLRFFNKLLGLDEDEFLQKTNGTFKQGIEFVNWGRIGDRYMHPFGPYGQEMEGLHFHHFWLRYAKTGKAPPLHAYSLQTLASNAGKFQRADNAVAGSPLNSIAHAFHFDAALYARFLREFAEARGVQRTEGKVSSVQQHAETGHVESVTLAGGETIPGEFFIDCTGFRGVLIEQTLKTGYDDWSAYLPVNSAVAGGYLRNGDPEPYTRAVAKPAGWQWHIPLQSRTGTGHVFCKDFMSDDDAMETFKAAVEGPLTREPYFLRFTTGIRKRAWNKNVVAMGLASGFLEPLESTSIHIIQTAVARLMTNFPDRAFNQHDIDYYNRRTRLEFEQIRDFLVLHYKATERDDTPFWDYVRTMDIPVSLAERIAIYKENGRLYRHDNELFSEPSWLAVMHGQRISAERYHPIADIISDKELEYRMNRIADVLKSTVARMPTHQAFIDRNCKANMAKA